MPTLRFSAIPALVFSAAKTNKIHEAL